MKTNHTQQPKIEKGIPLRPKKSGFTSTLRAMSVGDSFFAENPASTRSKTFAFAERSGRKYATRKEGKGVRVWRVK